VRGEDRFYIQTRNSLVHYGIIKFVAMLKYILLLTSMALAISGQVFFKKGVQMSTLNASIGSIIQTLLHPYVFLGFIFYAISSILWLFILQRFPLSVAYPALAMSYVLIVIFSAALLGEALTLNKVLGSVIIVLGVAVLFR